MPGTAPGMLRDLSTKRAWDLYVWNPPEHLHDVEGFKEPDIIASPKPNWSVIEANFEPALIAAMRPQAYEYLRGECKRGISKAYGEVAYEDEINKRLRGEHTNEQDTERDRLLAQYKIFKTSIESMTLVQLKLFLDSTVDWSADGTSN